LQHGDGEPTFGWGLVTPRRSLRDGGDDPGKKIGMRMRKSERAMEKTAAVVVELAAEMKTMMEK